MLNIRFAGRVGTMVARRVCADALFHAPQVVLDPHLLVHVEDDGCDVRKCRKQSPVVNGVLGTLSFTVDVIVLDICILASVAHRLRGIVLREESEAEWICFPPYQCVRIATLLAVLPSDGELLGVQRLRDSAWIHLASVRKRLARRDNNLVVGITVSHSANPLTKSTPWHLILVAATCPVPALRVSIVWAGRLLGGIRRRCTRKALVMICLCRVAPVAGVRLVNLAANMGLIFQGLQCGI
mmetsp:Transcript_62726/g.149760  ORF Transcript_62726/g.149760 Transcript_62726/m.149760 type:complete len:240 (+) Transcript_62726:540-1259(+)